MSKPVTNVEIEDVLSSIRRLVSSSDKTERGAPEETPDVSDKLVLTPSLRVDDDADGASDADETSENQDVMPETSDSTNAKDIAAEDAEVAQDPQSEEASDEAFMDMIAQSSASDDTLEEASDDTDEAGDFDTAEAELAEDPLDALLAENAKNSSDFDADEALLDDAVAPVSEPEDFSTGDEQKNAQDDDSSAEDDAEPETAADPDDPDENTLVRRAAEFEEIIAQKDDAWDPDGTTEDPNAGSSVGPLPWSDRDEADDADLAQEGADESDSVDRDEDEDADQDELTEAATLVEAPDQDDMAPGAEADDEDAEPVRDNDLARVMAEVAREEADAFVEEEVATEFELMADDTDTLKSVETETVIVDDLDDAAEVLEDEPVPFVFRTQSTSRVFPSGPEPKASAEEETVQEVQSAPTAGDEAMLDEEALRDMVSEIVRQELQGALGERITRNVRKLVRREIHRALASQELE